MATSMACAPSNCLAGCRSKAGRPEFLVEGRTARQVLVNLVQSNAALQEAIFEGEELRPHVRVMLNGRDIELADGLETAVSENDTSSCISTAGRWLKGDTMQGWTGKILDIDLTEGTIETVPLDREMARLFLGGRGLGARLLWDLVGPEVEPLSPENVLIFTTGPITASGAQTSNRFSVSSKSPLTGSILHANSGGWWGMQFKRTGYDVLDCAGQSGASRQ